MLAGHLHHPLRERGRRVIPDAHLARQDHVLVVVSVFSAPIGCAHRCTLGSEAAARVGHAFNPDGDRYELETVACYTAGQGARRRVRSTPC